MQEESAELSTLEYLFRVQQTFSKRNKNANDRLGNDRVAAYFGWHLNNRLSQYEDDIGVLRKKINSNSQLTELSHLCTNCCSVLTRYRSIPKKLKHKKRKKKGRNYDTSIINSSCEFCKSRFKFSGLKKSEEPLLEKNQKSNLPIKSKTSVSSHKLNLSSLNTPTSTKSHKEVLQKLLKDSKKKRSLDSKTKLSDFLSSCFDK